MVVTQLAWMAFQVGVVCAATFGAEQVIAWLGYEASYVDRPQFLNWLAFFFGFPALMWVMGGIFAFQIDLEDALEARRVDAVSRKSLDDLGAIRPLSDSSPRLIDRIGRRR